ncbi:hypothetical protein V8F33_002280 [Rhypophila sp. PSN 637]
MSNHSVTTDLVEPPDGDVNKGPIVLAITYVTTSIALLAVAMRMFVRVKVVKSVGWDDYAILLASAMAILVLAWEIMSVNHGNGRHAYYLSEYDKVQASKWSRLTVPPNLTACTLARVSFCLFLMRIVNRQRMYTIFLWAIVFITSVTTLATVINLLASCKPIDKLWNPKHPGTCVPGIQNVAFGLTQSSAAIAADFLLAVFPILILRKLNMALKTKIALGVLMGMGLFVGIAALIKTREVYSVGRRTDITWSTFTLTCFSIIEQNIGILAVSIPACRPLFSRYFKIGGSSGESPKDYDLEGPSGRRAAAHGAGYDLGNMSGKKKSQISVPNSVHVSSSRKMADLDENGSESSLVAKGSVGDSLDGVGITKTVSVSMRSYRCEGDGKM